MTNVEEFREFAKSMVDYICDYKTNIRDRKVIADVKPGYLKKLIPEKPPHEREQWNDVLRDVDHLIMPGITQWHHPHFFAYYPTANSYPAVVADMLSTSIACIGFSWYSSPACTELEMIMMDWLAEMLDLPDEFRFDSEKDGGGVIQGSASDATLVALLSAKKRALDWSESIESYDVNNNSVSEGLASLTINEKDIMNTNDKLKIVNNRSDRDAAKKLVAYASTIAHSSVERASMLGGITEYRPISVSEATDYGMDSKELIKTMEKDIKEGLIPFYVVLTLGTTSCCSFDSISEIGEAVHGITKQYTHLKIWIHIDAAYAGSSFICPEFRKMAGFEKDSLRRYVDSFNFNPHKWMLVNFDCSAMWVKDRYQFASGFSVDPLYLKHKYDKSTASNHVKSKEEKTPGETAEIADYRHWGVALGRRFRSLKLWFVIRLYGVQGLQQYIRKHVELAKYFQSLLTSTLDLDGVNKMFEMFHRADLGLVCFKLRRFGNEACKQLNDAINEDGKIHITPSMVNGTYILRLAICSSYTNEDDVKFAYDVICKHSKTISRNEKHHFMKMMVKSEVKYHDFNNTSS